MANKKAEQSIDIKGHVQGIGNVIGSHSTSHVEIKFSLFQNLVTFDENKTEYQRNPKFTADSTRAFSPHPDATFPELEHLIGHQAELSRLLELYDYAARQNKGAFIFLTGQYGYGTKALGRAFVDALRQGHGRTATTRFWAENNERHSRRDVRWSLGFDRWQEVFELSPDFLKQQDMFPFWGLFFQLCEKIPWMENEPFPTKLTDLPAYFRNCTQSGEPLVLLLEDFEFASPDWHDLIHYLAKEVNHALPILWIVTMHSDHPLDAIAKELFSPAQTLALELAENNIAEIYHLSRVTRHDVENYVAPAKSDVAERLHRLTDGVPILVQNLWQDWRRTNAVSQNDDDQWELNRESPWAEYGSGRDYIRAILDQLWPQENEAPWSAGQMFEILVLAAQEGTSFTVDALAKAFDMDIEKLVIGMEYLLDEPDDPGLVKEATPVILEMPSANWTHTLERFDFSPLLVWFTLTTYEKPNAALLVKYAEGLRDSAHPFVERFASKIAYLYEQANQPELAKKYHRLTNENDTLRKLMAHAELLLEFPESDIIHSRLDEISHQLYLGFITEINPSWTINFASHLVLSYEKSKSQHFLSHSLLLIASSKYNLGDYPAARGYYEKQLAVSEGVGSKHGIAIALGGLGDVARSLGDYPAARGYYEKMLAVSKEVESKHGITTALGGLGHVARSLGDYLGARNYYEKTLVVSEELGRKDAITTALGGLGHVANSLGDYPSARGYYEKILALEEEMGRKDGIAAALGGLGNVASSLGDYPAAHGYYEKMLALEEEVGSKAGITTALGSLGHVASSLGDNLTARDYYEKQLALDEEMGRKDGIANAMGSLGYVAFSLGDYSAARGYYEKQLTLGEELGSKAGIAYAFRGLGDLASSLGDYPAARSYYEKQLTLEEKMGNKNGLAFAFGGLGDVASSLGDYPTAHDYYEKQLALEEELGSKAGIASAFFNLGNIACSLGEHKIAREYYEKKLAIDKDLGRKHGIANALRGLANVAQSLGDYPVARDYYGQALVIEEKLERKNEIAETVRGLGDVANSLFEYQLARGYYERALNIFENLGSPKSKAVMEKIKKLDEIIKRSKHESET